MVRRDDAARDLLFGLLALQTGLISQAALVAAFHAWTQDKARPMAAILAAQGALDESHKALIAGLVAAHLKIHGDDPERSLAALGAGNSTREGLARIGDPDLDRSLAHVGPPPADDGDGGPVRTLTLADSSTSAGQRFRVVRNHARGGLGEVFVAIDAEFNREVALKEIQLAHAHDPASRSRFVLEAEITGGLEHPGIVPVYGLGSYADGRPFYAMRFIRGDSLKEAIAAFHADERLRRDSGGRSLVLRKLLRRFTDVCNAIEYAHGRGVLHRDLKPGNVMVGRYGETLVVDWGLAKVQGQTEPGASEERTLVPASGGSSETLPGSAVGTPAYMSPEQAAGDLGRLGPRSDVYSLGATLYTLLTGRPPFEGGDVGAVLRSVQRGEFPRPRAIDPMLDPALEAVCLKAMAVDPGDRYGSPRALAEDVERWTADQPVTAWREPAWRRAGRWAKRNRVAVTGAAAALLAGLVGLAAVAAVQARSNALLTKANDDIKRSLAEAREAKAATEAALADTRAAKAATDKALAESEESRRRAEGVLGFLKDDVLAAMRPEGQKGGLGKDVSVRQAIDAAEPKIAGAFPGQATVEADIRDTLGSTYSYLGEAPLAIRQHERALRLREQTLGPDHRDTLVSRNNLAVAYRASGRAAEAIALHQSTLKLKETKLGPDHRDTLVSRNNLAVAYETAGRTAEALALHESTLKLQEAKLGPDHPDTLQSRNNLAAAYHASGRYAEALALHQSTLKLKETKLGPDHPDTLQSRSNLAEIYRAAGPTAEVIALHETMLKLRETKLGPDHPDTLTSRNNLALAYQDAGRTAEALAIHESTLKLYESKLGPDHPDTLRSRRNLAEAYRASGRTAEALALHQSTLKLSEAKLGPDHPDTLRSRRNLAATYYTSGRTAEALALHQSTLKLSEARLGPDHPDTLRSRSHLAVAYSASGRTAEALALYESTLKLSEAKLGPDHPDTLRSRSHLASAYESLHRYAEAEALRRVLLARRRKTDKPDSLLLADDLAILGWNLLRQAKWPDAQPILRECLAIRAGSFPDAWFTFYTRSLLGVSLLGQGRYAEAEPLIVSGYEGMKAHAATIPAAAKSHLAEAGLCVVALYEALGRPEETTRWRSRLEIDAGRARLPDDVFARP